MCAFCAMFKSTTTTSTLLVVSLWLKKKNENTPRHAEKPKLFLDRNWLHGFLCLDVRKKNHTLNWTNKLIFRRRAQRALNENYYYTYILLFCTACVISTRFRSDAACLNLLSFIVWCIFVSHSLRSLASGTSISCVPCTITSEIM
jgi:hypothetical protein